MTELFANQAQTVVSSGGTDVPSQNASETWTVATPGLFPSASSSASPPTFFRVTDPAAPSEKMIVTNTSGATWTVTRGTEGTTPVAHSTGFTVQNVVTAASLANLAQGSQGSANLNPVPPPGSPFWTTTANQTGNTIGGLIFFNNGFNLEGGPSMTLWVQQNSAPFTWGAVADMSTANGHVKAYPCVQLDTNIPAGNIYAKASWQEGGPAYSGSNYNGPVAGIDYETAWDIFTTNNAREIMIWTRNAGQVPAGSQIGTVAIAGVEYDIWQNSNNYRVYVAQTPFAQATGFDVGLFIRDSVAAGFIEQTDFITQLCFGWEICQTNNVASDFSMSGFALDVGFSALPEAILEGGVTLPAYIAPAVVGLTDAATVAVNAALGNDFRVTLGGNRQIAAPSGVTDGQLLTFWIAQPASGGPFTPTFATGLAGYTFGSGSAPSWSTAAKAVDMITFRYNAALGLACYEDSKLGFAPASSPLNAVSIGALTSSQPSFGQATAAGHLLVAWLASNASENSNPFSTGASGWTQVPAGAAGGPFGWSTIFYKANCSSNETAPTFNAGTASAFRAMLGEFSGAVPSSVVDSSGVLVAAGPAVAVSNAAVDAVAGDLIISAASWTGNGTATSVTVAITDGTGTELTPVVASDTAANSPHMNVAFAYGIAGSAGHDADTATSTLGAFSSSSACIASFKAS